MLQIRTITRRHNELSSWKQHTGSSFVSSAVIPPSPARRLQRGLGSLCRPPRLVSAPLLGLLVFRLAVHHSGRRLGVKNTLKASKTKQKVDLKEATTSGVGVWSNIRLNPRTVHPATSTPAPRCNLVRGQAGCGEQPNPWVPPTPSAGATRKGYSI